MFKTRASELRRLAETALGHRPADLIVRGGALLNVYTGELLPDWSVAIQGRRIAYIGPDAGHARGLRTRVIEADGQTIIPGLIEGHTHVAYRWGIDQYLRYALPAGTTTVVTELSELAFALGGRAVEMLIAAGRDQPGRVLATVPPMLQAHPTPSPYAVTPAELRRLLARPEVLGLGESYWGNVLRGESQAYAQFAAVLNHGKTLEGHSAGARGPRLAAYYAGGVSSDHEPIAAEEALERLRLGVHVMLREGDTRQDLDALAPIWAKGLDLRRLCLVTDGTSPRDLLARGGLRRVVQRAIQLGCPPVAAIQMATLNIAEHFRLDQHLGGLAPGKLADLVLIPDLRTIDPQTVIVDGRVVVEDGRLQSEPRPPEYPADLMNTVRLPRPLNAEDFRVPAPIAEGTVPVRVIDYGPELTTRERVAELPVRDGAIQPDPAQDVVRAAVIDRLVAPGETGLGFVGGFGLQRGACASSWTWDLAGIGVVGVEPEAMALAANRLAELKGGLAVAADGQVLAELASPLGGFISLAPLEQLVAAHEALEAAAGRLGSRRGHTFLPIETIATAAIPFVRLTPGGLVEIKGGQRLPLVVS